MTQKNPNGRPKGTTIPIDWDMVDKMCAIRCTGEEIASLLDISYDTLERACQREKGKLFADYTAQKAANGHMSLRRKQYTSAMDGNVPMLIWLGKNWLGQTDKMDTYHDHNITAFEVVEDES